mgnify:CR=1 FL=1
MQLADAIVETLQRNGVSNISNEAEVRACLYRLRWHPHDIDRAVKKIASSNQMQSFTHKSALHSLLRSDERIRPETLSSLLGFDIEITEEDVKSSAYRAKPRVTFPRLFMIIVFGIILGCTVMVLLMWLTKTGLFHPTLWTY